VPRHAFSAPSGSCASRRGALRSARGLGHASRQPLLRCG
jgi:hypothetical protein